MASIQLPPSVRDTVAGLRIRLRVAPGHNFESLAIENLPFYIQGREELPVTLCEQCLAHAQALLVQPVDEKETWHELLNKSNIRPMGFEANEALLPYELPSFHGYRLLSEYFAFRERFLFVNLDEHRLGDASLRRLRSRPHSALQSCRGRHLPCHR